MKKLMLFLVAAFLMSACTTEQIPEAKTSLDLFTPSWTNPEVLNGSVKSLSQIAYWVTEEDGEYITGGRMTQKERDSLGWSDDYIAHFDSMGLIKKCEYLGDNEEVYGYWAAKVENMQYSKAKWVFNDTVRNYAVLSYDDMGKIKKMERYRAEVDTLLNSYVFKRNEMAQWIAGQWFSYDGNKGTSHKIEYNEMGRIKRREAYNAEGVNTAWFEYSYDENGFQNQFTGMMSDSTMIDAKMKVIETDEMGNWTKLVSWDNGELVGIDIRTIEYYQ